MAMKSYLWQWLVFSFICFYYGRSDGKPIFSNLVERVGQGFQRVVRSFKNVLPVSSSNTSENTPIGTENSKNSNNESDSDLEKLSDEEVMVELRKIANSDSEGTIEVKEILNDIEISKSSGKSLSQAINSAVKKVNPSRKQLKCGGGGLGLLSFFFIWFQRLFNRRSLLVQNRQAVGDSETDTDITYRSWLSRSPLARLLMMRYRRKPRPITKDKDKTETTQFITPTTTRIVEEYSYIVDENGVPTHRIINRQPIDSTIITQRFSTVQNPVVPVLNSPSETVNKKMIEKPIISDGRPAVQPLATSSSTLSSAMSESINRVPVPPTDLRSLAIDRPPSPPSRIPVTIRTDTVLPQNPAPVSAIRDIASSPPQPPETSTTHLHSIGISQPPGSPSDRFSSTTETIVPPNPPLSTFTEFTRILRPPSISTQTRSYHSTNSPPTPTLPNLISTIMSEINPPPTGSDRTEIMEPLVTSRPAPASSIPQSIHLRNVRLPMSMQLPSVSHQPDSLQLLPGAIYQRNGERPQHVYFDQEQNTFVPIPRETS